METLLHKAGPMARTRVLPLLVIAVTVLVFGAAIGLGSLQLRKNIRAQIVNHDGVILQAVALSQLTGEDGLAGGGPENFAGQLALALRLSRLREGVMAVRLFDAQGQFITAMPVMVAETSLAPVELAPLQPLQPHSHYHPALPLSTLFLVPAEAPPQPMLEVLLPLQVPGQTQLLGVAQLFMDGQNVARDFAALDRNLARQAGGVFLVGGLILAGALGWAFRKLARQNLSLWRANQELVLAAKTSAMGAVTAHLIHGLSNPLAGLQSYVNTRPQADPDWQDAVAAAHRMRSLVDSIVRILSEENGASQYELTLAELVEVVTGKLQPVAREAGVELTVQQTAEGKLSSRDANLVGLILENLVQNALQATPAGRTVQLTVTPAGTAVVCAVADEGPGIPEELRPKLFAPCRTTKPGGSGIGLAISQQLAHHLGAELELKQTGPAGAVFTLTLPAALLGQKRGALGAQTAGAPDRGTTTAA